MVSLNRDNLAAVQMKRAENLKMLYESGLQSFLEESFPGCTVILFGSYSQGEDTLKSDIDLAVIGSKGKGTSLEKFEKTLERKITLNFYENFGSIGKNLKANILNGITLSGVVEL